MAQRLKSADEFKNMGAKPNRVEARFEQEFWQLWDATEIWIPQNLLDEWKPLSEEAALDREFTYVCAQLARMILGGKIETPSPKLFRRWSQLVLAEGAA